MKKKYTREKLIALCESAIVYYNKWCNRDSSSAHENIGKAWAFLKAGCEYKVLVDDTLSTDNEIIWIKMTIHGFGYFEGGGVDIENFYIPTKKRLNKNVNGDWY